MSSIRNCGDCNAKPGDLHDPGCDIERCMLCGGQAISCDCIYEVNGMDRHKLEEEHFDIYNDGPTNEMYEAYDKEVSKIGGRDVWTGSWPGKEECIEFGWYSKLVHRKGWVSCDKNDEDARPDLNRLHEEARWSREQRRWVKK